MKGYRTLAWLIVLLGPFCFAQVIDTKGFVSRIIEERFSDMAKNGAVVTSAAYGGTGITTIIEESSKTRLYPDVQSSTYIDYFEYEGMCGYYINPYKKIKCNNKLNYLMEAHHQILEIAQFSSFGQINRGVKEQIMEKYVRITNTILFELEQLKIQVDRETFFRKWILNAGNE
jgi:hypothetical protein